MAFLGMRHVAIPVKDIVRARQFYCENFGFYPYYQEDHENWSMVSRSGTSISFLPTSENEDGGTPSLGGHYRHIGLCYSSKEDVDFLYQKLSLITHCYSLKEHRDKSYGFYFKDSESNQLEVIFIPSSPYKKERQNIKVQCSFKSQERYDLFVRNAPLLQCEQVPYQGREFVILKGKEITVASDNDLCIDAVMNALVDQIEQEI